MSRIIEGRSYSGIVIDIKPASALDGEGNEPIAIIKTKHQVNGVRRVRDVWLPISDPAAVDPGERVKITPTTEFKGKGSLTTFKVEPIRTKLNRSNLSRHFSNVLR